VFFCLFIFLFFFFRNKRKDVRLTLTTPKILLAVATTGFSEIILQLVIILSFQVIYGYVFYKVGIIITSFMVGLAAGGWCVTKNLSIIKNKAKAYVWIQVSICLYPLVLPVLFKWFSGSNVPVVLWLGSNIILPFLPILSGFIGGIQFNLANKICIENKNSETCKKESNYTARIAGLNYGMDLIGACCGALIGAAILIPVIGIFQTCFLASLINVTVLAILKGVKSQNRT